MILFLNISFSSIISVVLMLGMLIFCLLLILRNIELNNKVKEIYLINRDYLRNESVSNKEDIVSVESISHDVEEDDIIKRGSKKKKNKEVISKNIKNRNIKLANNNYRKSRKELIGDILNSERSKTDTLSNNNSNVSNRQLDIDNFEDNLDEFVIGNKKEVKKDNSYLDEVSRLLEEGLNKDIIELTDYERDQEDNAIISYKELVNVKDKLNDMDDEDFLDELKKFRNNLE